MFAKPEKLFSLFLLLMTLLRLRAASQFGLGVDEAHYVLYGKFLDWSYFDHPPLVGWTHALFQLLPLDAMIKARLPAILISLLTSALLVRYLRRKEFSEKHAFLAVGALNLTPMFNAMSLALLPDTFLMPFTVLILETTESLVTRATLKDWLRLGLWLGFAALAKYTAVLYVGALILIFIMHHLFRELLKPRMWAGIAVAFILVSPVLYWNLKNHFASFKYQAGHVLTLNPGLVKSVAASFVLQFFSWGAGPFIAAFAGFYLLVRMYPLHRIPLVFLSVFLLFFAYVSLGEVLLPHWMLMFFVLMVPLAYALFLQRASRPRLTGLSLAFSAVLTLALLLEMGFHVFPVRWTAGLYEGVAGWDEMMDSANARLQEIPGEKKALAVMNWTLGSRAMYYNHGPFPVYVIDSRHDQFDIWQPGLPLHEEVLVIVEAPKKDEHLAHLNCAQLTPVGEKIFSIANVQVNHFLYYHCADFLGYKE